MRRRAALALAGAALLAPAPAAAQLGDDLPLLGISDQKPATFADPRLRELGLSLARLVVPWDAIFTRPAAVDRWMGAARRAGARPLIAFGAGTGSRCPADPCILPRPGELAAAFDAFRAAYPWVIDFQTWNEVNHESQPTRHRPERAARLWEALRARCAGCRIVAADLLGDATMRPWLERFRATLDSEPPLWGLHNYRDVNDGLPAATDELLALVPGQVWFTETGGIVRFVTRDGRLVRPHDEQRAAAAIDRALDLGRLRHPRIERIYLYNWRAGPAEERFDSALVAHDGRSRPALLALWRRVRPLLPFPAGPPPAPEPVPWSVPRAPAKVTLADAAVRAPSGRTMHLRVRCRRRRAPCLGLLSISSAALGRVGAGAFAIGPGRTRRVPITLSRRAAAVLRRVRVAQPAIAKARLRTVEGAAAKTARDVLIVPRQRPREASQSASARPSAVTGASP